MFSLALIGHRNAKCLRTCSKFHWKYSAASLSGQRAATSSVGVQSGTSTGGVLYSKGAGVFGALGHGDSLQDVESFKRVSFQGNTMDAQSLDIVQVSAGWGHSAGVTADGRLFLFGRPFDFSNLMQLNRIRSVSPGLGRFVGRFTSWFGSPDSDDGLYTSPVQIMNLGFVTSVRCSAGLTVALTEDGRLYSFGLNRWGQCGVDQALVTLGNSQTSNKYGIHVFVPMPITSLPGPVSHYDVGLQHCVAVVDGTVYTWGKGTRGQLGNGEYESGWTPVRIDLEPEVLEGGAAVAASQKTVVQVSAGFAHTACLTEGGDVYIWGKGLSLTPKDKDDNDKDKDKDKDEGNDGSSLGANADAVPMIERPKKFWGVVSYNNQITPRRVALPAGLRAVEVVSSNFNVIIRDAAGGLWALGMGEYDRNMLVKPVSVQQAIVRQLESAEVPASAVLKPGDQLRKGYQRVVLLPGKDTLQLDGRGLAEYASPAVAYEVVVHHGEAFLQEVSDVGVTAGPAMQGSAGAEAESELEADQGAGSGMGEEVKGSARKQVRVLMDISTGWKHSLCVYASTSTVE